MNGSIATTSPSLTVREMVGEMLVEIRTNDLSAMRAAALESKLCALLANITTEIRDADMAFNLKLLECLTAERAANRARIKAETSPEYQRKREAHDLKEVTLRAISSLRDLVKASTEEMRLTR